VGSNLLAGSTHQFFSKPGPIEFREEEMESGEKRRWKHRIMWKPDPIEFSKLGPIKFREEEMESREEEMES
jgi:hypothetical protein